MKVLLRLAAALPTP